MKTFILFITSVYLLSSPSQAQNSKKDIDTSSFNKWGYVSGPAITRDGKYAAYISQYGWKNNFSNPKTLTVKSTAGSWTQDFGPDIIGYAFTKNCRSILIQEHDSRLKNVELGTGRILKTYTASFFELIDRRNNEWLFIQSPDNKIIIVNSKTGKEYNYQDIKVFHQDAKLNRLFLLRNNDSLSFVNLNTMRETSIGEFKGITSLTLNNAGDMIAFMMEKAVWVCSPGKSKPVRLADNMSAGIDTNLFISGISRFSKGNERLFIFLTEKAVKPEIEPEGVKVRVWNYQDSRLRTDPGKIRSAQSFLSFIDLNSGQITRVQQEYENARFLNDTNTDLIWIEYVKGADYERHWNKQAQLKHFIYDSRKKSRYNIGLEPRGLSPDGMYLIGLDSLRVNFIVWNAGTQKQDDLTEHLGMIPDQYGIVDEEKKRWLFAGWTDQRSLLLYDENDIWQFDVSNPSKAINMTHGAGRRDKLVFRFPNQPKSRIFHKDELGYINAFNTESKQSGFYKLSEDNRTGPQKLVMDDAFYSNFYIESKHANLIIIQKEQAQNSPNFFVTKDFRTFKPLSAMYPEKDYKWLTSELISFTTLDGKPSQAIVYKPADFDPGKKYPVIIHYYEKFSDELNHYLPPQAMADNLEVPWFVSKGYIVVKPDIQYTPMKALESAVNSVEGVARQLAKLNYIDSANMGIFGHSWGGEETNYIVTHSRYFKAAVSSAGVSNLISAASSITLEGSNFFDVSTYKRHERLGVTMWQRPDLYINNSPILAAADIVTPILLIANENDGIVNVEQGLQFFWALRRLGKPSWLLQYQGEAHNLINPENKLDYSMKTLDFFDHYLKGKSIPKWMTDGL